MQRGTEYTVCVLYTLASTLSVLPGYAQVRAGLSQAETGLA